MPHLPSPIQKIEDPLCSKKGVEVFVKREDLIHPVIMGNKWRKLKYNIAQAREEGFTSLLTLGGAFSNHIVATAAAAAENGLTSTGVIRGEELNPDSNPTLKKASSYGMKLVFVDREAYRLMREDISHFNGFQKEHYFLPEGGTNALALQGCIEMVEEINMDYDFLCTPVGTGGTMAGLLKGLVGDKKVLGFSVLKGEFIPDMFKKLLDQMGIGYNNYLLHVNYHFGGYGRVTNELIDFINDFKKHHGILLDPVYTGKMFFGVFDLIKQGFFKFDHKIILLHTGGIQGIEGYNSKHHKKIH